MLRNLAAEAPKGYACLPTFFYSVSKSRERLAGPSRRTLLRHRNRCGAPGLLEILVELVFQLLDSLSDCIAEPGTSILLNAKVLHAICQVRLIISKFVGNLFKRLGGVALDFRSSLFIDGQAGAARSPK